MGSCVTDQRLRHLSLVDCATGVHTPKSAPPQGGACTRAPGRPGSRWRSAEWCLSPTRVPSEPRTRVRGPRLLREVGRPRGRGGWPAVKGGSAPEPAGMSRDIRHNSAAWVPGSDPLDASAGGRHIRGLPALCAAGRSRLPQSQSSCAAWGLVIDPPYPGDVLPVLLAAGTVGVALRRVPHLPRSTRAPRSRAQTLRHQLKLARRRCPGVSFRHCDSRFRQCRYRAPDGIHNRGLSAV